MRFGKSPARYYTYNGVKLPSVTSILTLLSKGALIPWAANCAVDELQSVSDRMIIVGRSYAPTEGEYKQARTAYRQASIEAADYGTYIHTMCELYLQTEFEIKFAHEQTQKLMTSFYAWCKKYNVKPIETEIVVYGDGYAGRVDLICELDCFWYKSKDKKDQQVGRRRRVVALIDFKTGKGSYYNEWYLQAAGYKEAYNHGLCDSWNWCRGHIDCADKKVHCEKAANYHGVLKFNKETCRVNYKDMSETYERDLKAFMLLVKFWETMNGEEK